MHEKLDGGGEARGSWDGIRKQTNARYAAAQADVLAYIGTLDPDAAAYFEDRHAEAVSHALQWSATSMPSPPGSEFLETGVDGRDSTAASSRFVVALHEAHGASINAYCTGGIAGMVRKGSWRFA